MIVSEGRKEEAAKMLPETVRLVVMDTDDAWARDTGPTSVSYTHLDVYKRQAHPCMDPDQIHLL